MLLEIPPEIITLIIIETTAAHLPNIPVLARVCKKLRDLISAPKITFLIAKSRFPSIRMIKQLQTWNGRIVYFKYIKNTKSIIYELGIIKETDGQCYFMRYDTCKPGKLVRTTGTFENVLSNIMGCSFK